MGCSNTSDDNKPIRRGRAVITSQADPIFDGGLAVAELWQPSNARQIWVLAIGVTSYNDVSFPRVPFASRDACRFRDWSLHANINVINRWNVHVLLDEMATKGNVLAELHWLKQYAHGEDAVLIYFAGNGAPELDRNDGGFDAKYLSLYDSDSSRLFETALGLYELAQELDMVKAQLQVVVIEACFSGSVSEKVLHGRPKEDLEIRPKLINRFGAKSGRVILSAATAWQIANCSDEIGGGLFTHFLLYAWKYRGGLLLSNGFSWAKEQTRRAAEKRGSVQEPTRYGDQKVDLMLER